MYSVTLTLQRPNTSVSFNETNEQSLLFSKNAAFEAARAAAPGFLGRTKTISDDQLTLVSVSQWESQEAHAAFVAANKDLVLQRKALRAAYCSDNGIVALLNKE